LAPIDLELVETQMLTAAEREWLNTYHAGVRSALTPALVGDADTRTWLERATRAI
jgi:Xaa-Pro aminopeptidase